MKLSTLVFACVAITTAAMPASSAPLGTGITYQGVLTDAGAPLTGTADLRFRLFDAASGGAELGLVSIDDLVVTDGPLSALRIQREHGVEVVHPVEALARAYGLGGEK